MNIFNYYMMNFLINLIDENFFFLSINSNRTLPNNKKNVSQTLLFPVVLNLDTSEFKVLKTLRETLQHLGFIFDKFSKAI